MDKAWDLLSLPGTNTRSVPPESLSFSMEWENPKHRHRREESKGAVQISDLVFVSPFLSAAFHASLLPPLPSNPTPPPASSCHRNLSMSRRLCSGSQHRATSLPQSVWAIASESSLDGRVCCAKTTRTFLRDRERSAGLPSLCPHVASSAFAFPPFALSCPSRISSNDLTSSSCRAQTRFNIPEKKASKDTKGRCREALKRGFKWLVIRSHLSARLSGSRISAALSLPLSQL
mmetsp:Transcript_16623/g.33801  ORF Transcript_16623/g.33801 Transcript_16623/m.33801 type:complete len:232 (+) Transcript_16623:476-1171(+)